MSRYVVLNFEDQYQSLQRGAADSTVLALRKRYEQDKQRGAIGKLFLGKHRLVEHRCVEAAQGGGSKFCDDPVRLAQIRTDCEGAAKIYAVAHGDPRTTDVCYTNDPNGVGVIRLASYSQLGAFLKKVISGTDKVKLALVMCYGARCRTYQRANIDHMGMIAKSDLATSFAYQLYRGLAQVWDIRMTAVTGKIQHDSTTGRALVEVEEMIDENMEFAEAAKAQTVSKGPLIGQYNTLVGQHGVNVINQRVAQFRTNPNLPVVTPLDQYAHDLVDWENNQGGLAIKQRVTDAQKGKRDAMTLLNKQGMQENMPKYGKFIYQYKNNVLTITSKYGNPSNTGMTPMTVLYSGPLI